LVYESRDGVGSSVVLLMVRDAYANYVVQTAIDVVPEGNEKRMLLQELKAHEVQLVSGILLNPVVFIKTSAYFSNHFLLPSEQQRNYTFAKHIVAKLGT
jgi:pumilio RNA-binding family